MGAAGLDPGFERALADLRAGMDTFEAETGSRPNDLRMGSKVSREFMSGEGLTGKSIHDVRSALDLDLVKVDGEVVSFSPTWAARNPVDACADEWAKRTRSVCNDRVLDILKDDSGAAAEGKEP